MVLTAVSVFLPFIAAPAQNAVTDTSSAPADTAIYLQPYATQQSLFNKALAAPAKLLYWGTRPAGKLVIWMEDVALWDRLEELFWNRTRTAGIYPVASVGAGTRASVGFTAVHKDLLHNPARQARWHLRFTNPQNLQSSASYIEPEPFGQGSQLLFTAAYRRDSDENYFLTAAQTLETSYRTEFVRLQLNAFVQPTSRLSGQLFTGYRWTHTGPGSGANPHLFPTHLPGTGTASLGWVGASGAVNRLTGVPRITSGQYLQASYNYTHSLSSSAFEYHRLLGQATFVQPLTFLPPYRRVLLTVEVEQLLPANTGQVPFYELATLGGGSQLRGYRRNRFQDEGALLLSLEYHYPVWDRWDALLFVDAGQTFSRPNKLRLEDLHWTTGMGLRVYSKNDLTVRFDVGVSREGIYISSAAGMDLPLNRN